MKAYKWITYLPWDHIKEAATANTVPWKVLAVITQVESGGEQYATRYEANYRWLYYTAQYANSLNITAVTEEMHQKTSWGYCQVMGANARENGFRLHMPELCKPELNFLYACKFIKKLASKYTEREDVFAAYNAGSVIKTRGGLYTNQQYVDKCDRYLRDLDTLFP